ncbi:MULTISPECIES: GntR family transcriptional regulator [Paenibacillus]|uniref:GntR family transcriptional regulator n=1 Tax=Paenibacillus campinasensis TaxID=66347 RepID=A0ABW9TAG3_9BACL|nr:MULTISPECIES: GntR family transcriptional regulator [Paenibacillus]MUG68151.1 GntR family transcriptional regulator [Paenibacillus campinasensis]PAK51517.1 GntR family transcriptional regulator [Paenibacillus sp. 7541]
MIIELDLQSDTPIYTQLMNQIIEGIASGRLQPGEPLPSVRSLAADIGINLHTVNKAYTLLKQEGFIQIHRQKGVVVQPDALPGMTSDYAHRRDAQLRPIIAEAICRGMNEQQLLAVVHDLYSHITTNERKDAP